MHTKYRRLFIGFNGDHEEEVQLYGHYHSLAPYERVRGMLDIPEFKSMLVPSNGTASSDHMCCHCILHSLHCFLVDNNFCCAFNVRWHLATNLMFYPPCLRDGEVDPLP